MANKPISNMMFDSFVSIREGIWLMVLILTIMSDGVVEGICNSQRDLELETKLKCLNKPTIKTIESEDGDIIDCVDIYKQPAFDHPLLKNHTIQMRPSFFPKLSRNKSSMVPPVQQSWQRSGSCPQGTIPILRTQRSDLLRAVSLESYGRRNDALGTVEGAGINMDKSWGPYHGIRAQINVWSLHVEPNEWSHNSIMIGYKDTISVEAGWGVNPVLKDNRTRLFTYWTADGNNRTGCYNILCPGFIQVSRWIALGAIIAPLSTYKGSQYIIEPIIYKDNVYLKWWMFFGKEPVGYWPMKLFSNFLEASTVQWAGAVLNSRNGGQHTTTQMGSGHFPQEGWGRSSYFGNALYMSNANNFVPAKGDFFFETVVSCYDVDSSFKRPGRPGIWLYYGGPGGSLCG